MKKTLLAIASIAIMACLTVSGQAQESAFEFLVEWIKHDVGQQR
jgi:hypothetical protein